MSQNAWGAEASIHFSTKRGQNEFDRYEKMTNKEFMVHFRAEWEKFNLIAEDYRRRKKH